MDVFVARQPIFDRHMNIYGYELLYRRSEKNVYEGIDDHQATAEVINNAFLTMHFKNLTGGTLAFINFPHTMIENETPFLLPRDSIVIEVLERAEVTPKLIEALKTLREEGYTIALDDFAFEPEFMPLLEIAHIVKVEFPSVDFKLQREFIRRYRKKTKFLAEKVETREEYEIARKMGYDYFQGYFFSQPVVIQSKEIESVNLNQVQIIYELDREVVDFQKIEEIIHRDVGLTYKLLKLVNTLYYDSSDRVTSIQQALVRLGINEIRTWVYLLMVREIENIENKELLKVSVIRAKFMELLAIQMGEEERKTEYFLVGLFSEIDVLVNRSMEELVDELALTPRVKDSLLGEENSMKNLLDLAVEFEGKNVWTPEFDSLANQVSKNSVMDIYLQALAWAQDNNYQ